ncbi:MFS transporter [Stutzerimonas kirkiae]|uniref:Uncharacterized MFS-type transporter DNJ96_04715 n=1 Tax=Stutzerimonas kirkiae TaxID=2211392 RepID=A0A4Q9RCD0_9GAMM|nr:MFS transporter [Stutzerimonas kirkiae]TBU98545.1 MFS transporter [Stutzerimonas kirkiae]TBV04280.1 MFS transporter [Stutzerimonas kirkiae]
MAAHPPLAAATTRQIVSIVVFAFVGYLCAGLPLAVLPGYVLDGLGHGSVMAGVVIGTQYLATLLSRPVTGAVADRNGPKYAVLLGLAGCAASGALTLISTTLHLQAPLLGTGTLLVGRVILGMSLGLVGTGAISWGIGRFGAENTARVISWNGIAAYGGIALGAPLGVLMVANLGLWSLGSLVALLGIGALSLARGKTPAPLVQGLRMPFRNVFLTVAPNGVALGFGSIGFGTLATFITLYYASLGWEHAAYCLSAFGLAFIGARLLLSDAIKRHSGYRVAAICLAIESSGLLLLWLAPAPWLALCGAALTGAGLSLVYPALGVEVIARIPAASRSSALGAYALFFDLALGLAGPLMGVVASAFGYASIFLVAALLALAGMALSLYLLRRARP